MPDQIFREALSTPVLVNLPAQVAPLMDRWLEKNQIFRIAPIKNITFVNWFLCTGGYDSIQLFKESVDKYGDKIPHVLVRNNGLCFSWSHLNVDRSLQDAIDKYSVKVIDFPALDNLERNLIDEKKLTFSAAIDSEELEILSQHKVYIFLGSSSRANQVSD